MRKSKRKTRFGQVLDAYLRQVGVSREDFAIVMRVSKSLVDKTICGERIVTWRYAKKIEEFTNGVLQADALMRLGDQPAEEEK